MEEEDSFWPQGQAQFCSWPKWWIGQLLKSSSCPIVTVIHSNRALRRRQVNDKTTPVLIFWASPQCSSAESNQKHKQLLILKIDQEDTWIWESLIFLLSAKQTRQGRKKAGRDVLTNVASSLKPKNIFKNSVCSGENLTGGTLKVAGHVQSALPCGFWCSWVFLQKPDSSVDVWT